MRGLIKANLLPLVILIPLVAILQYLILKPHLGYAFADVDWMFLLYFKELSAQYHDPVSHFINAWNKWGVYTYQVYYIGLIEQFFGSVYKNFQIVTLIFKIVATLSIYPVIYLLTKNKIAAFLTTLIYSISYSSVGVMYTVVTSGLYVAIPVMNLFFAWYIYLITKGKNTIWEILTGFLLFSLTLLLATERMYPLLPTVILIELFWWFRSGFIKTVLFNGAKRLLVLLTPFVIVLLYKPSTATLLSGNTEVTYHKFISGNWQVILSPIISLGGLFIPKDYWPIFGTPMMNNLSQYLGFLMFGPMVIFILLTVFFIFFLSCKRLIFLADVLVPTTVLSIIVYFLSTHQLYISDAARMHFDFGYVIPALIGCFIISFTFALFREWVRIDKKDRLLISMVGGIVIAGIFIILTWIAADYVLVFTGIHRYLTIPAIGSCLLIAGLMTKVFNKMEISKFFRPFAFTIFLFLIPLTIFNSKIISDYMKYELEFAGTDAASHIRMKEKFWSFLGNLSESEPSIFYFDESADYDNGYFDETTIMAGFNYWMQFRGRDITSNRLTQIPLRSNLICPEPRSMCLNKVKSLITFKNGEAGILFGDVFYKKENFYAFRFINRDIVDIKPEMVKAIGLE